MSLPVICRENMIHIVAEWRWYTLRWQMSGRDDKALSQERSKRDSGGEGSNLTQPPLDAHNICCSHWKLCLQTCDSCEKHKAGVFCDSKYGMHYLWYSPLYTKTVEHKVVGNSFHLQLKTAKMLFSLSVKETEHSRPYYDTININSIPIWWSMQTNSVSSCFALENNHLKSIGTTESPQDCHHRKIFSGSDELKPGSWQCYANDPIESDICLNTSRFEVFTSLKGPFNCF